jgi:hypothetical protein
VKDGRGFTQTVVPLAVPETITVPAGAISANLPINTSAVSIDTPVSIYATIAGIGAKGTVSVGPARLRAASLAEPGNGHRREPCRRRTVTLTGPAPAADTSFRSRVNT